MDYLESDAYNRYRWDVISVAKKIDKYKENYSEASLVLNQFKVDNIKNSFSRTDARDKYINSIRETEEYSIYLDYSNGLRKGFNKWFDRHWETEIVTTREMEYMGDIKVRIERINHYINCGLVDAEEVDPSANLHVSLSSIAESDKWLRRIGNMAYDKTDDVLLKAVTEMMSGLSIWLKCCGYSDYEALEILRGRFDLDYKYADWYNGQGYIWYSEYGCAYIAKLLSFTSRGRARVKADYAVCVDLNMRDNKLLRLIPVVARLKVSK